LLETCPTTIANPDLASENLETQELHVFGSGYMALLLIDRKAQVLFEEPHNALKYSMSSAFGLHQDDEVICPSTVAVATPVKFVVQLIEHNIREYWRNRGTLGASLRALVKYSIDNHAGF
jgi:hypothetical protein